MQLHSSLAAGTNLGMRQHRGPATSEQERLEQSHTGKSTGSVHSAESRSLLGKAWVVLQKIK